MCQMPICRMKKLYHVGQMDRSLKRKGSLEGAGLSVSTEPYAWVKINPFTGGKLFELSKDNNRFLDYYRLTDGQKEEIVFWGVEQGYVERCKLYQITYYDDEMEMELCSIYKNKEEGLSEAENYEVELEVIDGFISTSQMEEKVMSLTPLILPLDLLSTIYSEEVLDIDGVWWDEILEVSRYSAPRGVISDRKLKEWDIRLIREKCY